MKERQQKKPRHKKYKLLAPKRPFKAPESEQECLDEMHATEQHIKQVKECLADLVENIQVNQSFFTRMSLFWGQIPIWQKLLAGVVIFGGLLTLGILTHTAVLIAVTCVSAVASLTASLCLDNHHAVEKNSRDRLKASILDLANILGHTINALELIRAQLAKEIDRLAEQIQLLEANNDALHHEIGTLHGEVKLLSAQTEKFIELEMAFRQNQAELDETKLIFAQKAKKFIELEEHFKHDINALTAGNIALRATTAKLAEEVIKSEAQRHQFLQKLDHFLDDKEASFDQIADRICQAEQELVKVKTDFRRYLKRYKGLLDTNEQQVGRLEIAANKLAKPHMKIKTHAARPSKAEGFFDHKRPRIEKKVTRAAILAKYGFRKCRGDAEKEFDQESYHQYDL